MCNCAHVIANVLLQLHICSYANQDMKCHAHNKRQVICCLKYNFEEFSKFPGYIHVYFNSNNFPWIIGALHSLLQQLCTFCESMLLYNHIPQLSHPADFLFPSCYPLLPIARSCGWYGQSGCPALTCPHRPRSCCTQSEWFVHFC